LSQSPALAFPASAQTYVFGRADFPTASLAAPDFGPSGIVIGDFNGDGVLDSAVPGYYDGTLSILLGKADGTVVLHVDYPAGCNQSPSLLGTSTVTGILTWRW